MPDIQLIYYCYPYNAWFSILKSICDIVLSYKCSSIIFKDVVSIEDDLPDFSITSPFMNKLHTKFRMILQSVNQEKIVKNSFYILSIIINRNDFKSGSFVLNLIDACDKDTAHTEIRFKGSRSVWKELIKAIDDILQYFLNIKASFLHNSLTRQGVELIINLLASFKKSIKIISNSVSQNKKDLIHFNINNSDYLFDKYISLMYIPTHRLCRVYQNNYINFEPRQGKTEITDDKIIYKIYFDGVTKMKYN